MAQRTQAHERACRAHSLGPRNRLPSSVNPHTGSLAWTAAFSQASALAAAFFTHAATKCESDFFYVLYRYCTMHTVRKSGARKSSLAAAMLSSFVALHTAAYSACSRVDTCGWRGSGRMPPLPCKWPRRVCAAAPADTVDKPKVLCTLLFETCGKTGLPALGDAGIRMSRKRWRIVAQHVLDGGDGPIFQRRLVLFHVTRALPGFEGVANQLREVLSRDREASRRE